MTLTMNESILILVDYKEGSFVAENLQTRESIMLPEEQFISNLYKYSCDFERKFTSSFSEEQSILIYTKSTSKKIDELIYFNRIDN